MTQQPMAYFDNAATTEPLYIDAASLPWGNANSPHSQGAESKRHLLRAKQQIAALLGLADRADAILCVSGGTEANNMVLCGKWDLVLSTYMEHEATLRTLQQKPTAPKSALLPNFADGRINVPDSLALIRDLGTKYSRTAAVNVLLSVIWANNEIGTLQSEADLLQLCTELQAVLPTGSAVRVHLDAVQAVGHTAISLAPTGNLHFVHYLSVSAHKWHGPPGMGFLVSKDHSLLNPLLYGGSQQGGLRPGTEPVGLVVHAARVLRRVVAALPDAQPKMRQYMATVRQALQPFVAAGTVLFTGHETQRSANHISFCVRNTESRHIVAAMDRCHIAISAGSACSADSSLPSHVLLACNIPAAYLYGAVRITCSMFTTPGEVARLCRVLTLVLEHNSSGSGG